MYFLMTLQNILYQLEKSDQQNEMKKKKNFILKSNQILS